MRYLVACKEVFEWLDTIEAPTAKNAEIIARDKWNSGEYEYESSSGGVGDFQIEVKENE